MNCKLHIIEEKKFGTKFLSVFIKKDCQISLVALKATLSAENVCVAQSNKV